MELPGKLRAEEEEGAQTPVEIRGAPKNIHEKEGALGEKAPVELLFWGEEGEGGRVSVDNCFQVILHKKRHEKSGLER